MSVRVGAVAFTEADQVDYPLTENLELDGIAYSGQSPSDPTQGLRKARHSCFTAGSTNAKVALLVTPGILSDDIRMKQDNARQVILTVSTHTRD